MTVNGSALLKCFCFIPTWKMCSAIMLYSFLCTITEMGILNPSPVKILNSCSSPFPPSRLPQGAVPKGNATKEFIESLQLKPGQVVYKCPKCCSIKPDRAHHCRYGMLCKRARCGDRMVVKVCSSERKFSAAWVCPLHMCLFLRRLPWHVPV